MVITLIVLMIQLSLQTFIITKKKKITKSVMKHVIHAFIPVIKTKTIVLHAKLII